MSLPSDRRGRLRGALLAAALGTVSLAGLPTAASAKTFVASFEDRTGDGKPDARDVVEGRIAYNRKSGALSATVRMNADILDEEDDAIVFVIVSDLRNGKCYRAIFTIGTVISDPSVPVAWKGGLDAAKPKQKYGSGSIEGDTIKMRVKAKSHGGQTPGCTAIVVVSRGDSPKIIDETPIENGFA
ncbi:MAG: hypothetical protein J7513_07670 [Solirubrobacteraceae bacterium]|nr:hypothetical protein [Solirubrobacteraceae bacterium]